jgi:hypothetical protein
VFGKLAVLIVALGLIAASLLAMRQMRTQAAHELAQARLRAVRIDQETARLRAMISTHVNPERVIEMASRSYLLKPLLAEEEAARGASRVAVHQEPSR